MLCDSYKLYLITCLGASLGTRVYHSLIDFWYNNDDEELNKLKREYPKLRFCSP